MPPPKGGTQPQGIPLPHTVPAWDTPWNLAVGSSPAPTSLLPMPVLCPCLGRATRTPNPGGDGGTHATYHLSMVEPFFRLLLGYSSRQTKTPATLRGESRKGVLGARISPEAQPSPKKKGCLGQGRKDLGPDQGGG